MKKTLTEKDLLLLLGILVAIIVGFTTLVYVDEPAEASKNSQQMPVKTGLLEKPAKVAKTILHKVSL